MDKLKADKVYSKEIEYQKNGKDFKFIKYSIRSGATWYSLQGKGKENIKEGDTVFGEISSKDYVTKDGKEGTEFILDLIDPIIADLINRVETLEGIVFAKKQEVKEEAKKELNDLPF